MRLGGATGSVRGRERVRDGRVESHAPALLDERRIERSEQGCSYGARSVTNSGMPRLPDGEQRARLPDGQLDWSPVVVHELEWTQKPELHRSSLGRRTRSR